MAIVKHLASEFHSEVSVEGELSKGSTFSLKIPLSSVSPEGTSES